MSANDFYNFPKSNVEEWMEIVKKDLKSTPYNQLQWIVDEDIILDPIQNVSLNIDLNLSRDWERKSSLIINNSSTNESILFLLNSGVNAITFDAFDNIDTYNNLLSNVNQQFISWQIKISNFEELQIIKSYFDDNVDITFHFAKVPDIKIVDSILKEFVNSKFLIESNSVAEQYSNNIVKMLVGAYQLIQSVGKNGFDIKTIIPKIVFQTSISNKYLQEIAYLRAIHLTWKNFTASYDSLVTAAKIVVNYEDNCLTNDRNENLIRMTTMGMSAILGTVYKIECNNYLFNDNNDTNKIRLINNIQLILGLESYLDQVVDPTSGSYFLDSLTQKLTEKSWKKFIEFIGY